MGIFADAKLKAGVWLRERKERAEAKKATSHAMNSEHGHGRFFLLHVPAMATICAAVVEWYWAILFCIEATGGIDWNYQTTTGSSVAAASTWNFAFETHWPIFLGLVCATIPIVMLSMVWLPVQFAMRGTGMWRRGTVIAVGVLANILVIVSGTVVMNGNRQEQVRADVVTEQTAAQGRAAIEARLAFEQEQLRLALNNTNPYLNQAANVGAEEWERSYVAQARASQDPRLPQLERALGAARAADARRANIERLTIERATAAPEAASAANVEDEVGAGLNTFAQIVEVWRPPFVAVICCLIGIFGAWWVLALMQGLNPKDVLRSGWAPESHRIEDHSDEDPIAPQPMKPAREVVTDAETGEELIKITPKPHWRKAKGKKQKLDVQPDIPPDETGVEVDGGNRTASVNADPVGPSEQSDEPEEADHVISMRDEVSPSSEDGLDAPVAAPIAETEITQPEPSTDSTIIELSDEERDALFGSAEELADEQQSDEQQDGAAEAEPEPVHSEPRTEPEQDERRLIAANVAAE